MWLVECVCSLVKFLLPCLKNARSLNVALKNKISSDFTDTQYL